MHLRRPGLPCARPRRRALHGLDEEQTDGHAEEPLVSLRPAALLATNRSLELRRHPSTVKEITILSRVQLFEAKFASNTNRPPTTLRAQFRVLAKTILIPASAPDFFTEDTPTAVLLRQVLSAIAQFEKTSLVAKLKAARDRKKAATGKCGGRKTYAEARPDVVLLAKQMHDQGMSLRKISAELAARGHVTAGGRPYVASAVQTMLG